MKKFVVGMVIGTVVGTAIGATIVGYGIAKLAIEDGVDISAAILENCERGRKDSERVIHSFGRKYSTPERRR